MSDGSAGTSGGDGKPGDVLNMLAQGVESTPGDACNEFTVILV